MKNKSIIISVLFAVVFFVASALCLAFPEGDYSDAERRELARFPEVNAESIESGEWQKEFEKYSTDRFPGREFFRGVKAFFAKNILIKSDNNGIFTADGHISKLDDAENEEMMNHAAERFTFIYDKFLQDNSVYLTIVPDKNFVLAEKNGYPSLDYRGFIEKMRKKLPFMEYIDVTDLLSVDDYYRTDTHWKQEKITDISDYILNALGKGINGGSYKENTSPYPFYGVYSGQYALPVEPDEITYLTNDTIDNAIVTYYPSGLPEKGEMYNMEKAKGRDPYEMFLSGTMPLIAIEKQGGNPHNHLILFRDSFGSSVAPLFLEGYDKITLIDTRYMASEMLGNLVNFDGADVMFLYSTTLLNNSLAIR